MTTLAVIPNPLAPIIEGIGGGAAAIGRQAAEPIVHAAGTMFLGWLADACRNVGRQIVDLLAATGEVDFTEGWWAGPRAGHVLAVLGGLAAALTVAFLLLAVLQGLWAGDPMTGLRAAFGHVPASIFGMVVLVGTTQLLLRATDEAAGAVLSETPAALGRFVDGFGVTSTILTGGLAAAVLMFVFLIGALMVWAELVVRSALVYLLVAFAPLALAARIWPATRGVFRRLCELGVAIIVSKLVIAVALALGAAALAGGGPGSEGPDGTGLGLAGLLGGATLMGLAAFTPFVVLRLLPTVEAAVVAHGISRSPARGAQAAGQVGSYPARMARLATGAKGMVAAPSAAVSAVALPALASNPLASRAGHTAGTGPGRAAARGGNRPLPGTPAAPGAPQRPASQSSPSPQEPRRSLSSGPAGDGGARGPERPGSGDQRRGSA